MLTHDTDKKPPCQQNVGFGIIIALGLTAGFGFWYTTIHGVLPFLALGIGIDNMFVILRCLENIPEEERERNSLVKNVALTMQRAGVSITVTTATDVAAFGVGTIAVLPALKHFCVSSAIAVAAIYLLQVRAVLIMPMRFHLATACMVSLVSAGTSG